MLRGAGGRHHVNDSRVLGNVGCANAGEVG